MGLLRKGAVEWNIEGVRLRNLGRNEEAVQCYDRAITIDPSYAKAWNNKGFALGNMGRNEEAVQCYDRAIAIDPNYANAWNNKGSVLCYLRRYQEAIQCYDRAIAIKPKDADDSRQYKEYAMSQLAECEKKAREEEVRLRKEEEEEQADKARLAAIERLKTQLSSAIIIMMPEFMDSGTTAQVSVILKNASQADFTDIHVNFSDMAECFEIEGEVRLRTMKPGMELENHIIIKPKYPKGTFPVKVRISGNGATVEKEYTIKVGGTEVY